MEAKHSLFIKIIAVVAFLTSLVFMTFVTARIFKACEPTTITIEKSIK